MSENHWNRRKLPSAISHGRWGEKTPNALFPVKQRPQKFTKKHHFSTVQNYTYQKQESEGLVFLSPYKTQASSFHTWKGIGSNSCHSSNPWESMHWEGWSTGGVLAGVGPAGTSLGQKGNGEAWNHYTFHLQRANRWTAQKMGMSTKCPKNVEKMSEKCPKIVRRGWKHNFRTFFGQFLPVWSMLLFGDPVQCTPVKTLHQPRNHPHHHFAVNSDHGLS